MCIFCNKYVIPDFKIGKEGIEKDSIKLPQCENCLNLSCYRCYLQNMNNGDNECPKCYFQFGQV